MYLNFSHTEQNLVCPGCESVFRLRVGPTMYDENGQPVCDICALTSAPHMFAEMCDLRVSPHLSLHDVASRLAVTQERVQ